MFDDKGSKPNQVDFFPGVPSFDQERENSINLGSIIKPIAVDFAVRHGAQVWLIDSLKYAEYPDKVVSDLRHIGGGQIYILEELQKIDPTLRWYRGGDLSTWKQSSGFNKGYSEKEFSTFVIDHGQNGALGRPRLAESFLFKARRAIPVVYSLGINDLIDGLQTESIQLVAEHEYDLRVLSRNHRKYISFCQQKLKIQRY